MYSVYIYIYIERERETSGAQGVAHIDTSFPDLHGGTLLFM